MTTVPAPRPGFRWRARVRIVLLDLWRTFFIDPVRANVVRSHGGGTTAVSMVGLGVTAFAVAVVGVVRAATIGATPVGPGSAVLANAAEPGLPVTIPTYFYPALTSLVLVGAFLGTFGAVYARRWLAVVAVGLVFLVTSAPAGFAWGFRDSAPLAYLGLPAALALPVVVVLLRWRTPSPPVVQLVTCVACVLAVVGSGLAQVDGYTLEGTSFGVSLLAHQAELVVGMVAAVVTPAVLLAGAGAVSFGRTVTDFLARTVGTLTGRRPLLFLGALGALLLWRVAATGVAVVRSTDTAPLVLKPLLLALVLVAAAWWWDWATRGFDESADEIEAGAGRAAAPVSVLWLLLILLTSAFGVVAYLDASLFDDLSLVRAVGRVLDLTDYGRAQQWWSVALGVGLAAWAAWSARRRPTLVAAWVGVAGAVTVLVTTWNALIPGRGWGVLERTDYARAALVVVLVAAVRAGARWRSTRVPPDPDWTLTAFSAVALTALVAQETFLDDPFRPLLGFTGVGLVFFGLVWGFLTAGAHSTARGLAGLGRTLVMLSYAVVTTTLVAWGDATGGAIADAASGDLATAGKALLGASLLVSLLAVWIPVLFGQREIRGSRASPAPARSPRTAP